MQEAKEKLPEKEFAMFQDNLRVTDWNTLPMLSFGSVFDGLTDAFRGISPSYDPHFSFLSDANSRLENPHSDMKLHIYVQNSIVNNRGELVVQKFECADGIPGDLRSSCELLKQAAEEKKEEQALETEIEQILEDAILPEEQAEAEAETESVVAFLDLDGTNQGREEAEAGAEDEAGAEEEMENEDANNPEEQGLFPNLFDQLMDFFKPVVNGIENNEAEDAMEMTAEPEDSSSSDSSEEMEMIGHDCGGMHMMDDGFMERPIPFSPFQGLFKLLMNDPEPVMQKTIIEEPARDPFFPWKNFDQFEIIEEPQQDSRITFAFPINRMKRVNLSPTTTTLEAEELFGENLLQDSSLFVDDYKIETAILATLVFVLTFLGLRRVCRKTTCTEACGEVEITSEQAKEMTELPKDFHEQLVATESLEDGLVELDLTVSPAEVENSKIVSGDGI